MLAEEFYQLFRGNPYAVGTEEGGVNRHIDGAYVEDWFKSQLAAHLGGGAPIGVYPMYLNNVHWGCIDFDEGETESREYAYNTARVLHLAAGITAWPERSRSKGWHVWVFANEWVEAQLMREALLAACQIVDAPTKEINPKQVSLDEGQLGNYVRLPYPGGQADWQHGRRTMHDMDGEPLALDTFIADASETLTSTSALERMAAKYQPPPPPPQLRKDTTVGDWQRRLGPVGYTMIFGTANTKAGPMDNETDRSAWLWRLMQKIINQGDLTQLELVEALVYAHDKFMPDKFNGRAYEEIGRMVAKGTS